MSQTITAPRIKLGLEDLLFGSTGEAQSQERQGELVPVTPLTEDNFPYDETRSLKERMDEFGISANLVENYGPALIAINANIDQLLKLKQFGVDGNNGNAGFLQGSNLAAVRANIDASRLEGLTVAQIKGAVDAITLEGQSLAQVRAGINAVELQGSDLLTTRANINAAKLENMTLAQVKTGGNAATVEGYDEEALLLLINKSTIPDASPTTKGKVRLITNAERIAGITSAAVPVMGQVKQLPNMVRAVLICQIWKPAENNNTSSFVMHYGYEIDSVTRAGTTATAPGVITATLTKAVTGTAYVFAEGTAYRTVTSGPFAPGPIYGNGAKLMSTYSLNNTDTLVIPIVDVYYGGTSGYWRTYYYANFTYFVVIIGAE